MKLRFGVVAAVLSIPVLLTPCAQAAPSDRGTPSTEAPSRDKAAMSDLLRGAATGDVTLIKSALKRGAPLEVRDSKHLITPLGWAAWRGHSTAVTALLDAGANINARSVGGQPIPLTMETQLYGQMATEFPSDLPPLSLAILGHTPTSTAISRELLRRGANPNAATERGYTPLIYASFRSDPALINALLAKGADPNTRAEMGLVTPLGVTTLRLKKEEPGLVKRMLDAGANPNESFLGRTLSDIARLAKRNRSAALIEAAQKTKLKQQIREAAKPPIVLPEFASTATVLN